VAFLEALKSTEMMDLRQRINEYQTSIIALFCAIFRYVVLHSGITNLSIVKASALLVPEFVVSCFRSSLLIREYQRNCAPSLAMFDSYLMKSQN